MKIIFADYHNSIIPGRKTVVFIYIFQLLQNMQEEDLTRLHAISFLQKRDWDQEKELQKLVDGMRPDKCLL